MKSQRSKIFFQSWFAAIAVGYIICTITNIITGEIVTASFSKSYDLICSFNFLLFMLFPSFGFLWNDGDDETPEDIKNVKYGYMFCSVCAGGLVGFANGLLY